MAAINTSTFTTRSPPASPRCFVDAAALLGGSTHLAEALRMAVTGNFWKENPSLFWGRNVRSREKIKSN